MNYFAPLIAPLMLVILAVSHISGQTTTQAETIVVQDTQASEVTVTTTTAPLTAMAISPDGRLMLLGSTAGVAAYTRAEKKWVQQLLTQLSNVHDLQFSPQGDRLLIAGGKPGESGDVELWSWPQAERLLHVQPHDDLVTKARWTEDGEQVITASFDGRCVVFNARQGVDEQEYAGHSRPVLALDLLPGGLAVSGGVDQSLRVWDRRNGQTVRELNQSLGTILDLVAIPNADNGHSGKTASDELPQVVSIGSDRTVRLWQPTIGRLVRFVKIDEAPQEVAWDSSTNQIVVVCRNNRRLEFDRTLKPVSPVEDAGGLAPSRF